MDVAWLRVKGDSEGGEGEKEKGEPPTSCIKSCRPWSADIGEASGDVPKEKRRRREKRSLNHLFFNERVSGDFMGRNQKRKGEKEEKRKGVP